MALKDELAAASGQDSQFVLAQGVDHARDPAPVDGPGAHRAWLGAGVEGGRGELAGRQGTARLAHQVQFRVTGDVALRDDGVLRLAEHVAGRGGQQGAERMVTVAPGTLGQANGSREEPLVLRCEGGQRGSFRARLIRVVRAGEAWWEGHSPWPRLMQERIAGAL